MKTTYGKINNALPALSKIAKLDIKATEAVKLARLIGKIEEELKPFDEARKKLFEKFGKEDKNGGIEIPNESFNDFSQELRELLDTEVDIDAEKVVIESDIAIDAASVLALGEMVTFGGE